MKSEIEHGFEQFIQSINMPLEQKDFIDFIGINLDEAKISFKVYIGMESKEISRDCISKFSPSGFIERLTEKDMIYRLEIVQDTRKVWSGRYDIALDNRTNENMEWLFQKLKKKEAFMADYEKLLRYMFSMKIFQHTDYQYAALYHLGVQEKDKKIRALKFYFTARHQEIPEYKTNNFEYREAEYLDFFENCDLSAFSELKDVAENMLLNCHGHVWMSGFDISEKGISKCKIYLKNLNGVYTYLKTAFGGIYRERAEQLENFHYNNPWLSLIGLAVGLNDSDCFSLNLYFAVL